LPFRRWFTTAMLLALPACGNDSGASVFHTADSAGVQIATSAAPAWTDASRWRIDTTPLLEIGGDEADPAAQFAGIAGALLLPDSGVVVADEVARALRFFDARGALVASAGRKGAGPGEYEDLSRLRRAGDSLLVWDSGLRRMTLLDADGRYVRSFNVTWDSAGSWPRPEGQWSDGRFLFESSTGVWSDMPVGPVRATLSVLRFRADGGGDSVLGRWRGRETVAVTTPQSVSSLELPYARHTIVRWHPGGFWIGTGDGPRIDRHDMDGRLVGSIRWSATETPIVSGEFSVWRDSLLRRLEGVPPELGSAFGKAARMVKLPAARPPYRTFLVSDGDELWVQRVARWDARRPPVEWDVFEPSGRWLGAVVVPAGVEPLEIRGNLLLAQWNDEDDVPHIRIYEILRMGR
jgi:hypothetical protein